jgi:hypothetical protein
VAILEEGINEHPAQAFGISWIVNENFEFVAVESVKPILGAKPHKPLIVLHNLCNLCLGQPVASVWTRKSDVRPIHDG